MARSLSHKSTRFRVLTAALLAAIAALGVAFVGVASSSARERHAASTTVREKSISGVGTVLVDSAGRTLYVFSLDKRTAVKCSTSCEKYWPQLVAQGKLVAGPGLKKSLLGKIKAPNGKEQVTYNRWPLYTYAGDTKSGEATGEQIVAFGGTWKAIHASGTPASKQSGGGGGGYGY
ncbi:MAG: hypothetical protein WB770_03445 [Acidimicrobiales bacterium]